MSIIQELFTLLIYDDHPGYLHLRTTSFNFNVLAHTLLVPILHTGRCSHEYCNCVVCCMPDNSHTIRRVMVIAVHLELGHAGRFINGPTVSEKYFSWASRVVGLRLFKPFAFQGTVQGT
jgi:hypothetical protein